MSQMMHFPVHRSASKLKPFYAPICIFLFAFPFHGLNLQGEAWTHYRGPRQDGTSKDPIRLNWSESPPRLLWKIPLEPALSSFSVSDGRAFTQVKRRLQGQDREVCIALDSETGRELWARDLDLADYPNGGVGWDDGPRSTPTIDGDRLYVFSSYLKLHCLNIQTGETLWDVDFVSDYGATVIPWQNAASPLVVGDLVLVNGNAGSAKIFGLNKHNGSVIWRNHDERMTQSSPVHGSVAGAPHAVFLTQKGLLAVNPGTGESHWRYPFRYSISSAASPVLAGDRVYCSAAYGSGAALVEIRDAQGGFSLSEVWHTPGANMNHWATSIVHEGHLYGVYGQSNLRLECLEIATGRSKWSRSGVGYGSVLKVADHLLVLEDDGAMVVVGFDSEAYRELERFQAVEGKCWNNAAISDGRLYVRSTNQAAAYDLSFPLESEAPLRLEWGSRLTGGPWHLNVLTADDSGISESRAQDISILESHRPRADEDEWTRLEVPLLKEGMQWRFAIPVDPLSGAKYFRAVEIP